MTPDPSLELDDPQAPAYTHEQPDWPAWVKGFRPHQVEAVEEIIDAYRRGVRVVFLDAPTGAGKTLIAEMVRRRMGVNAVYVCNSKSLQDQFLRDFSYSRVLKGRANYPTELQPQRTADDCIGQGCSLCTGRDLCPYQVAKVSATVAPVAVLNTAYWLGEANSGKSAFAGADFVVCDESDTLEAQLMGAVEFRLSAQQAKKMGLKIPVKGARVKTIRTWLEKDLAQGLRHELEKLNKQARLFDVADSIDVMKERTRIVRTLSKVRGVVAGLSEGGEDGGESWGDWVRDYDYRHEDDLVLKPVRVGGQGAVKLWPHAHRWLCMSASLISPEEQAESLGLDELGWEWETVTVPMTFPVENRPIVYRPAANITYATRDVEVPKMLVGLEKVLVEYPDENVLVHTVNYKLAGELYDGLCAGEALGGREAWTYRGPVDRASTLDRFKERGGVLLAPSMDRGIDLPDDLCRVVVVAKIPFLNLSDRQVSERMRGEGGQTWYAVQVARTLVQMTGRGVRSEDDWCSTFILDKQFGSWWKDGRRLMPGWWKEALNF